MQHRYHGDGPRLGNNNNRIILTRVKYWKPQEFISAAESQAWLVRHALSPHVFIVVLSEQPSTISIYHYILFK